MPKTFQNAPSFKSNTKQALKLKLKNDSGAEVRPYMICLPRDVSPISQRRVGGLQETLSFLSFQFFSFISLSILAC
jgi:hypothetical protein